MSRGKETQADLRKAKVPGQVAVGSGNQQLQAPADTSGGSRTNTWTKIGILAGVVGAIAAVIALFIT